MQTVGEQFKNLRNEVNLIMLFLLSGSLLSNNTNQKVYTFVDNQLLVYNNNTTYLSILIHELEYNIRLLYLHSETSYRDSSYLTGLLLYKETGLHLCSNATKSWQLGWYENTHLILNAEDISNELHSLINVDNHNIVLENTYIIVRIMNCTNKFKYYVNFIQQKGITLDNVESDNIALVIRVPESSYEDSKLVA